MSSNFNFLKTTTDLIESSLEIKSYIHQQIVDFNPFITPETLIVVVARDPLRLADPTTCCRNSRVSRGPSAIR